MSNPREWIIDGSGDDNYETFVVNSWDDLTEHGRARGVHVIEKNAYDALAAKNEKLRKALEFYAKRDSWHISYSGVISPYSDINCINRSDLEQLSSPDGTVNNTLGGKTAREVLEETK